MTEPSLPRERWPDLATVELLVGIAEQGGLGAAARHLGMAQPNATRSIRRLEAWAGTTLVERDPRGARLTVAGLELAERARPLLARAADFRQAVRSVGDSQLLVAASQTIAECLAGGWLAELYAERPTLQLGMQVCNSDEVLQRVVRGRVGLGFVESGRVDPRVQTRVVARDRLVVLVAPGHPWARRSRPVSVEELARTPLAVRERGSGTREVLERQLPTGALIPAVELSSNSALLGAVAADLAPAVLSELAARAGIASGQVVGVPVRGLDLGRELHAVWPRDQRLRGAAYDLVRIAAAGG